VSRSPARNDGIGVVVLIENVSRVVQESGVVF
jgi:hypothetical protein